MNKLFFLNKIDSDWTKLILEIWDWTRFRLRPFLFELFKPQIRKFFLQPQTNQQIILKFMKKSELQDFKINVKFKLSALWASVTFCYLYGDYFELYVPKKVEGLMNGDNMLDSPTKLFIAAFLLLIPALMVCLSIILRPVLNRVLNIFLGLFFTLFVALVGASSISEWRTFYVFYAVIEIILTSMIVWFAWCWERKNDKLGNE
jgi:hypothetical protein